MTDTKRLSLHGRLRMTADCPDPNASLLAEAADAIAQHEAFRQEVSDAVEGTLHSVSHWQGCDVEKFRAALSRFIIAKPDPLEEAVEDWINNREFGEGAASLRAAIEKRGGKIVWGEG